MTEQEKREQINEFLTLFIGGCWHEFEGEVEDDGVYRVGCILCGADCEDNPDFYQPNDFDRLRKWMEKNEPELWDSYCSLSLFIEMINKVDLSGLVRHDKVASKTIGRILNPSNLYEFLKERREEWGYIDTHIGNMADGKIVYRDIHPAAKYLDSLEAKND